MSDPDVAVRTAWSDWAEHALEAVADKGQLRHLRTFDAAGPSGTLHGRPVVSFASNDYLGLSVHPTVVGAAHRALDRWGTGATASRLVVGTRPAHTDLEVAYAEWKGTDAALVFSSGYAANVGVLTTVGGPGVRIFSDELNHASIIDGCRLARAEVATFRHRDVDHLSSQLAAHDGRSVVVTDTVFSMDGDVAPLAELSEVCRAHDALLVVDEAHDVFGVDGIDPDIDLLRVGTLSKTLGGLGGIVAGSRPMIDLLVNRARSFIFSTGLPPADVAAAHAALDVMTSGEGSALRHRLRASIDRLDPTNPSPIVPVLLGSEAAAVDAADALLADGILVPAIRPPTVPPGTSRLRVALSAAHTDEMLDRLVAGLANLRPNS